MKRICSFVVVIFIILVAGSVFADEIPELTFAVEKEAVFNLDSIDYELAEKKVSVVFSQGSHSSESDPQCTVSFQDGGMLTSDQEADCVSSRLAFEFTGLEIPEDSELLGVLVKFDDSTKSVSILREKDVFFERMFPNRGSVSFAFFRDINPELSLKLSERQDLMQTSVRTSETVSVILDRVHRSYGRIEFGITEKFRLDNEILLNSKLCEAFFYNGNLEAVGCEMFPVYPEGEAPAEINDEDNEARSETLYVYDVLDMYPYSKLGSINLRLTDPTFTFIFADADGEIQLAESAANFAMVLRFTNW